MTHAFRIHRTGGPEVLSWEQVEVPAPAAGVLAESLGGGGPHPG